MNTRTRLIRAGVALTTLPFLLVVTAVGVFYANFYAAPRANRSLLSSGERREYLLHVPGSYDPKTPTPLVLSLHGAALWPASQMALTGWNDLADEQGFIVAYPSGTTLGGGRGTGVLPKAWLMEPESRLNADVTFISDLIDTLGATYNIDHTRVYLNGLSNGGGMVFALSCTIADRVAAVGTVAAAQVLPWSWCTNAEPVPMVAFHGTADRLVPYNGSGPSWLSPRPFPSVASWAANWAHRNRCGPIPGASTVAADVTRLDYTGCANGADVVLYTIRGGGHAWPGGKPMPRWMVGPTTRSIDATRLTWAFFSQHRLQRR